MIEDVLQVHDQHELSRPGKRARLATVERGAKQLKIRVQYDGQGGNKNCASNKYQQRHSRLLINCRGIRGVRGSACRPYTIGQKQWSNGRAYIDCLKSPCLYLRRSLELIGSSLHHHTCPKGKRADDCKASIKRDLPLSCERGGGHLNVLKTLLPCLHEEIERPSCHAQNDSENKWCSEPTPQRQNIINVCEEELACCKRQSNWPSKSPKKRCGSNLRVPLAAGVVWIHRFDFLVNFGGRPAQAANCGGDRK